MGNLLKRQQGYGKLQPDERQQQQDKPIEMEAGKNLEQDDETAAAAAVMNDEDVATLPEVVRELRELSRIAVPITAMNCVVYVRAMVSVLCLGRLGGLELAGGALSIGFTNITGYSVLFGLASGMDPICSQAFGNRNWHLIDLSLQRTVLFLAASCIPIAALWINMERILLALGQDAVITAVAQSYCLWSLPDLLANAVLQPLRVFFRCQGLAAPMMWCSAAAVALHIPLNIVLVFVLRLGVPGVAVAAVLTNFNMIILLLAYLRFSGAASATWSGCWRLREAARDWGPLLSLALPSCCAICLEWWWYEIMTILAGYLPDPRVAVATTAVLIQTTSLMYTVPLGLNSSVGVRVGFELGAGRPAAARRAALVALGVAAAAGGGAAMAATAARHAWGRLFTSDAGVLALTAAAMPIVGLCELGNCPQTTGCGVLRGSARPSVGARINLASFYLVGTPVAVALAFWLKLGFEGLWFGLLAAQAVAAASILWEVLRTDWQLEAARAASLTKPRQQQQLEEIEIVEPPELGKSGK